MATLITQSTTFVGDLDPIGGIDLPGELEPWEDVVEVACDRCGDPTTWPVEANDATVCPPSNEYVRRTA